MTKRKDAICDTMIKLLKQSETFRLHLAEKKWRNHVKRLGTTAPNKDTARVMLADFGATLDLGATEKGNCGIDNHAVICALLVARGWRQVARASSSTDMSDATVIDDCGKWVIFGDTVSKGKKRSRFPQRLS